MTLLQFSPYQLPCLGLDLKKYNSYSPILVNKPGYSQVGSDSIRIYQLMAGKRLPHFVIIQPLLLYYSTGALLRMQESPYRLRNMPRNQKPTPKEDNFQCHSEI